ncbi:MAG: exo-alpha-sialidase [Kiritimatiellae bacterium]|nr:exo-alpha-sialidase [Kiritimatiellia bacterium]
MRRNLPLAIVASMGLLAASAFAATSPARDGGEIRDAPRRQARAEILWTKPLCREPGRYIGWPTVGLAPNGDLLAVFSGDRDAHICPWGKVQIVRSADGGETWSEPETICNSPIDDRDAGILLLDDGTLLLSWFTSVAYRARIRDRDRLDPASRQYQWSLHDAKIPTALVKEQLGAFTRRSIDGGRTWEPPVRTPCSAPHGPIQLRDGRLLYVGKSGDADQADLGPGVGKVVAESRDGGRSWRVIGEVPFPEGETVLRMYHEPHAVEADDGRIVAQIRHECPWMPDGPRESVQTESADGGRTWTMPRPVGIGGFPPHLLRLSDGTLLSTYAKRTGELGEYACLSDDGGRTWDIANEIKLAGHWSDDIGYPSSVQLPGGNILTAYYQSEREGEPPCLMSTLWRIVRP